MTKKRTALKPILDNLTEISNPFKQSQFSVSGFFDGNVVSGVALDYEYALKFLTVTKAAPPPLMPISNGNI